MVPGTPDSAVDLIALDFVAAAVEYFATDGFQAGRTFHLCGGKDVMTISELLERTRETFLQNRPSWRKRGIEMPAIVDLPTFELFARSVEEVGDHLLRSSVAAIRHFAPQLAYPKIFGDAVCASSLRAAALVRPAVVEFYPKVVRWLVETGWAGHGNPAKAAAGD
jgi:hypothetical protein